MDLSSSFSELSILGGGRPVTALGLYPAMVVATVVVWRSVRASLVLPAAVRRAA